MTTGILVFGLSFSGAFTTLKNWYFLTVRLSVLTALEHEMGMYRRGILPREVEFRPQTGFRGHIGALVRSGRFPLALFYSALSGCGIAMILEALNRVSAPSAVIASLAVFLYSDLMTFSTIRRQFGSTSATSDTYPTN